jgi:flagellar hook-length control protein FliK
MNLEEFKKAGADGDKELVVLGKESVPSGNVSGAGAAARQVYMGDNVTPKNVVIPTEQIIKEAGNLLERGGKVQLILHPPNLGRINMEVIVRNNRVELLMMVGNTDVQQVLQASSDQLRNSLQNQGFQFDQLSILLKRENSDSGGNPLWQGEQQGGGKRDGRQEAVPTEILSEPGSTHYDETGNISIFV